MVVGAAVDDEALKDCFSHVEASDSGVGELRKMSKSGTHCSISGWKSDWEGEFDNLMIKTRES